jgi:hypothetical protein
MAGRAVWFVIALSLLIAGLFFGIGVWLYFTTTG